MSKDPQYVLLTPANGDAVSHALGKLLTPEAAGLAVVGIDDGIGAGTIAARIARQSA